MLSCSCNYAEYLWWYEEVELDTTLDTSKRKRCVSCSTLIEVGGMVTKYHCYRDTKGDIEERIYGNDIPLAPKYECESCSDLRTNLESLGFCILLGDNLPKALLAYQKG